MKKLLLQTVTLSALVLLVGGTVASAGDADGKTNGTVNFKAGAIPDPIKPETQDPLIPTIPTVPIGVDDVYIIKAPGFVFGEVAINPQGQEYPAQQIEVSTKDTVPEKYYMPDFLQVADVSGNSDLVWSVTAQQDEVFMSSAATGSKKLENTRIRLYGQTLTQALLKVADNSTDLVGLTLDGTATNGAKYAKIPVGGTAAEAPIKVLESKTGGFTNNTFISNVLMAGYDTVNFGPGLSDAMADNTSVKLNVPATDSPEKIEYTAAITWTLSVTP